MAKIAEKNSPVVYSYETPGPAELNAVNAYLRRNAKCLDVLFSYVSAELECVNQVPETYSIRTYF